MTGQSWSEFDTRLRIKLQESTEPRVTENQGTRKAAGTEERHDLTHRYTNLDQCVYETIKEVVSERKWIKKERKGSNSINKRALREESTIIQQTREPNQSKKRKWNKIINNACRND